MLRRLAVFVPLAAFAACSTGVPPQVAPAPSDAGELTIRLGTVRNGRREVRVLRIEEYVLASVLSEISAPGGDVETARTIFSVQALSARTYAIASRRRHASEGFDVCDTTHCQVVDLARAAPSRWTAIAREAVAATSGRILWYQDRPATALYHADCGGYRAAADDVWGGPAPDYLRGGEDELPDGHEHMAAWRVVLTRDELLAALNANQRTAVGTRLDTIDVQRRDRSGRAALLLLNGERSPVVRGEEFRAAVSRRFGPRSLRSSRFEVRREGERFVFDGRGFGHGVGLCQRGAVARASAGHTTGEILSFYFPGTAILPYAAAL